MKKYYFEADRTQWEKSTEPNYRFCAPLQTFVYAETDEEARALAKEKLHALALGTGYRLLGEARMISSHDQPIDWNYGYGDERGTGTPEDKAALLTNNLGRL